MELLRWALPKLGLRWEGFRKVRRQVCRRIRNRIGELGVEGPAEYRALLERRPEEWAVLDRCCRITISRFYRDRGVFEALGSVVLPDLAREALAASRRLTCWSVGCASGEEPYSLVMLWQFELSERFPDIAFEVVATDIDSTVLERAERGCYEPSSIRDVPERWLDRGFERRDGQFCLRPQFKTLVTFSKADVRRSPPRAAFQLVLCRNLVFTYFSEAVQIEVLEMLARVVEPGGALVLGSHESLPDDVQLFERWQPAREILRRRATS